MSSHYHQWENLPLMHVSLNLLEEASILEPRYFDEIDGSRLISMKALMHPTLANTTINENLKDFERINNMM